MKSPESPQPPEGTAARPRRRHGRLSTAINLDRNKAAICAHKANNKARRGPAKRTPSKSLKKITTSTPAHWQTAQAQTTPEQTTPEQTTPEQTTPEQTTPEQTTQEQGALSTPCYQEPPELHLPPPVHSLTESNLRAHTQQTNPGEQPLAVMAPTDATQSETTVRATIADNERQLLRYGVVLDSKEPLPNELKSFLRHVVRAPRGGSGSPAAKILHQVAPSTQIMNEFEAIEHLAPHLGFLSAHTKDGAKYNHMVPEVEFNLAYISHRDDPSFKLKKPRVDKALGYMRREFIRMQPTRISNKLQPAFTADEETKLLDDAAVPPISRYVLCPWYTMEFKSFEAYAGLKQAKLQAARNGAAACEHMYQLYRHAGVEPTAVDTMHWSLTCDTKVAELFFIWRQQIGDEPARYHMRCEWSTLLQAPNDGGDEDGNEDKDGVESAMVADLRNRLRNLLDHASGARLTRIKTDVLARIPIPRPGGKSPRKRLSPTKQPDKAIGTSTPSTLFANKPNFGQPIPQGTLASSRPIPLLEKLQGARSTSSYSGSRPANSKPAGSRPQNQGMPRAQVQQQSQVVGPRVPGSQALSSPSARSTGPPGLVHGGIRTRSQQPQAPASNSATLSEPVPSRRSGRVVNAPERYGY